ncbi:MAG: T9SS type A sorting domain-containing protein [Reichenbachiella sp.]
MNKLSIILLATFMIFSQNVSGQLSTNNDYSGTWSDVASWSTAQPAPLTTLIAESQDIIINGYITREGDLSFANIGNNSFELRVIDTLVVEGDLSFANNSISLSIESGGVLVVFGSLNVNNKVDLQNGGNLVVQGDLTLSGGNADYTDNGGGVYVAGTITASNATLETAIIALDQPITNLDGGADPDQSLFDFVDGGGATPLPVELFSFESRVSDTGNYLKWETASELNNAGFEIEVKTGVDEEFRYIAFIEGNGTTNENQSYSLSIDIPKSDTYYRLKQVDFDGAHEYSKTIIVKVENGIHIPAAVFPNPTSGEVFISAQNVEAYQLYNINGALLTSGRPNSIFAMEVDISSQLSATEPGMYYLKLVTRDGEETIKIIKQ